MHNALKHMTGKSSNIIMHFNFDYNYLIMYIMKTLMHYTYFDTLLV